MSDDLDAAGLGAFFALDHLELDLGSFLKEGAAGVVGVNEDVFAPALRRDETKSLSCVEELNGAFLHWVRIMRHWRRADHQIHSETTFS